MAPQDPTSIEPKQSPVLDYEPVKSELGFKAKFARVTFRWSLIALVPALLLPFIVFGIDPVNHHMLSGASWDDHILPIPAFSSVIGIVLGLASGFAGNEYGFLLAISNFGAIVFIPSFNYA